MTPAYRRSALEETPSENPGECEWDRMPEIGYEPFNITPAEMEEAW